MTTFLAILLIGCIIAIVLLWGRCRDLTSDHSQAFDNWGFWEKKCKAERADLMRQFDGLRLANQKLHDTNSELLEQLGEVRKQLADELENNCRLVHRLNAAEARLADAELRIAAATENLTNQPRVIVEDECPC